MIKGMVGAVHMKKRAFRPACSLMIVLKSTRRMDGLLVLAHGVDAASRVEVTSRRLIQ